MAKSDKTSIKLSLGVNKESVQQIISSIDNLSKTLEAKLKLDIKADMDDKSLKNFEKVINGLDKSIQALSKNVSSMSKQKVKVDTSDVEKAKKHLENFNAELSALMNEGDKRTSAYKEKIYNKLNNSLFTDKGKLTKFALEMDTTQLQKYLELMEKFQSSVQKIKTISNTPISVKSEDLGNGLIKQISLYDDLRGKTQEVTNIINSSNQAIISSTQKLTDNSATYLAQLEAQKARVSELKQRYEELKKAKQNLGQGSGSSSTELDTISTKVEQLVSKIHEITKGKNGHLVDSSEVTNLDKLISQMNTQLETQKKINAEKQQKAVDNSASAKAELEVQQKLLDSYKERKQLLTDKFSSLGANDDARVLDLVTKINTKYEEMVKLQEQGKTIEKARITEMESNLTKLANLNSKILKEQDSFKGTKKGQEYIAELDKTLEHIRQIKQESEKINGFKGSQFETQLNDIEKQVEALRNVRTATEENLTKMQMFGYEASQVATQMKAHFEKIRFDSMERSVESTTARLHAMKEEFTQFLASKQSDDVIVSSTLPARIDQTIQQISTLTGKEQNYQQILRDTEKITQNMIESEARRVSSVSAFKQAIAETKAQIDGLMDKSLDMSASFNMDIGFERITDEARKLMQELEKIEAENKNSFEIPTTAIEKLNEIKGALGGYSKELKTVSDAEAYYTRLAHKKQEALDLLAQKERKLQQTIGKKSGGQKEALEQEIEQLRRYSREIENTSIKEKEFAETLRHTMVNANLDFRDETMKYQELLDIYNKLIKAKEELNNGRTNATDIGATFDNTKINAVIESIDRYLTMLEKAPVADNTFRQGVQSIIDTTGKLKNELKESIKVKVNTDKAIADVTKLKKETLERANEIKKNLQIKHMNTLGIDTIIAKLNKISPASENAREDIKSIQKAMQSVGSSASGANLSFKNLLTTMTGFYGIQAVFIGLRTALRDMIEAVTGIDDAFINLSRVATSSTGDVQTQMQNIRKEVFGIAGDLGTSAVELTNSMTEFSKLGYDINEAFELAQSASKYATTGWLELADATDALTASYTVFGGQFDETIGKMIDSTTIIDAYNSAGNNLAITSDEVGQALKQSANSLSEAGNEMSEAISLIATANKTVQSAEKVGRGLKTISMRLRGEHYRPKRTVMCVVKHI